MKHKKIDCHTCKKSHHYDVVTSNNGWLPGIFIAILPKCPFCFLAFSSTIMVCTEEGYTAANHTINSGLTAILAIAFCALTLGFMVFNYRADRSPQALFLSASGAVAVITSTLYTGGFWLYYLGATVMLLGVWLNGNLLYFIKKLKYPYGKQAISTPPITKSNF